MTSDGGLHGWWWFVDQWVLEAKSVLERDERGVGEVDDLCSCSGRIGGIRVRHRLNDDGMPHADRDATNSNSYCFSPNVSRHGAFAVASSRRTRTSRNDATERSNVSINSADPCGDG